MQRLMTLVNKMANSQDEKVREVARIVANIISHVLVFFLIAPCPPKSENKNTKIFEWSGKTKPALNWPFHTKEYFGWCCKKTPCITEMKSFLRSGILAWSWRSCQDPTGTRGQSSLPNFIHRWSLLPKGSSKRKIVFCGFCSNRILLYFPMCVC